MLTSYLRILGVQRSLLLFASLILVITSLFSGGNVSYEGLRAFPTIIAPALVPIVLFVLCLDILMSLVYMSDKVGKARERYRIIIRSHGASIMVLALSWSPFFYSLATV